MTEDNQDLNDESNRTSIWSVPTKDRFQFSVIFFTLFLIGTCLVSYYEIWIKDNDSLIETIIALMRDIGAVGVASVVITLARFEGGDIVGVGLERYRAQRLAEGKRLGRQEGIKLGKTEGIKLGRQERDEEWEAWIASRPDIQKLIAEDKENAPPTLNGKDNRR